MALFFVGLQVNEVFQFHVHVQHIFFQIQWHRKFTKIRDNNNKQTFSFSSFALDF